MCAALALCVFACQVCVCVEVDQFPLCRHHVPSDRSCYWLFKAYLALLIFQTHSQARHRKGVALFGLFSCPFVFF